MSWCGVVANVSRYLLYPIMVTIEDALPYLPIKALGMVILSHILSRTSKPDSGELIAFTIVTMSLCMDR